MALKITDLRGGVGASAPTAPRLLDKREGGDVVQVISGEEAEVRCIARMDFLGHSGRMHMKGTEFVTTASRARKYAAALVASPVSEVAKRETKIVAPAETKPVAPVASKDYGAMSKAELEAEVAARGVAVKATGRGGNVVKADLLRALGA